MPMADRTHMTAATARNATTPTAMRLPPNRRDPASTTLPTTGSNEPNRSGTTSPATCATAPMMPIAMSRNAVLLEMPVRTSSLFDMPYS